MSSPSLNPSDYESRKTREERAEDIAYTINHALACTATDFIDPYVGNWTQEYLGKRISIGCGHDHSHEHHHEGHTHSHHDHAHGHGETCSHHHHHDHSHHGAPQTKSHLAHWWIGEIAGDFGAVPVTIAFQRYAPNFMDNLRQLMEPVLGPVFHLGARMSARSWANTHQINLESQACKEKEQQIYDHEIRHLPQALIWTASSVAINLTTQKLLGNTAPLWQMGAGKAVGAGISAALVVAGRALMPQTARKWDQFTSKNIFLPMTKVVGTSFGVQSEDVDRMAKKENAIHSSSWQDRIQAEPSPEARVSI